MLADTKMLIMKFIKLRYRLLKLFCDFGLRIFSKWILTFKDVVNEWVHEKTLPYDWF